MFKSFKTAGFNLEDTHLKDYERLDRLLTMVALTFVWAYKVGIYRNDAIKPIKIKKHGRPEKSIFAYGLEWLAQVFINQFFKLTNIHRGRNIWTFSEFVVYKMLFNNFST